MVSIPGPGLLELCLLALTKHAELALIKNHFPRTIFGDPNQKIFRSKVGKIFFKYLMTCCPARPGHTTMGFVSEADSFVGFFVWQTFDDDNQHH